MLNKLTSSTKDLWAAVLRYELVGILGWHDVRQRYKRSTMGPFWLTISMGVTIGVIGFVFSQIYQSTVSQYLPFLAIGMILWTFFVTTLNDGCLSFISADLIIKQLPIPLFVHVLRIVWRNIIIFAHNAIIYLIVLIFIQKSISWVALLVVPGFILVVLNLIWLSLLLAILCTRYRDLPQIINSLLQVFFYLTPIMWMPQLLGSSHSLSVLELNPLYHLFEVVRGPLLGEFPRSESWLVSVGICLIGWLTALLFYARYRLRITYWL